MKNVLKNVTAAIFACTIITLLSFGIYAIFSQNNERQFTIKQTEKGYNIYYQERLEWEFTRQNTDSLSLETLRMIYEGD